MLEWISDSIKPLLDDKSLHSNLSEEEVRIVAAYAMDRLSAGLYNARKEEEAKARERKVLAKVEVEFSAINRLLGDKEMFPRSYVLQMMIELLTVTD